MSKNHNPPTMGRIITDTDNTFIINKVDPKIIPVSVVGLSKVWVADYYIDPDLCKEAHSFKVTSSSDSVVIVNSISRIWKIVKGQENVRVRISVVTRPNGELTETFLITKKDVI